MQPNKHILKAIEKYDKYFSICPGRITPTVCELRAVGNFKGRLRQDVVIDHFKIYLGGNKDEDVEEERHGGAI